MPMTGGGMNTSLIQINFRNRSKRPQSRNLNTDAPRSNVYGADKGELGNGEFGKSLHH
jgi:hypothetical protein